MLDRLPQENGNDYKTVIFGKLREIEGVQEPESFGGPEIFFGGRFRWQGGTGFPQKCSPESRSYQDLIIQIADIMVCVMMTDQIADPVDLCCGEPIFFKHRSRDNRAFKLLVVSGGRRDFSSLGLIPMSCMSAVYLQETAFHRKAS
ncbi:MAG: hypothetical protein V8S96_09140 [Lachnospiraceae bacterium]